MITCWRSLQFRLIVNITVFWWKLKEFELAKSHCDVTMKFDLFNVKALFGRATSLLNLGLKEEARKDLLVVIRFDPNNEEVRKELDRVEKMCNANCRMEAFKNKRDDVIPIPEPVLQHGIN